eukprot:COSAG05_NODE_22627_length_263_cov_0.945122_1_plen_33_part_01
MPTGASASPTDAGVTALAQSFAKATKAHKQPQP